MQLSGKRALALVAALSLATAGSAFAQDTTEAGGARFDTTEAGAGAIDTATADTSAMGDTTDTSGVQNPPGYRGMERDTTIFPPQDDSAAAGRVEDKATGTYDDSAWQDTSETEVQNPPGYRGMERPVGGDSAAEHDTTEHSGAGAGDTTAQTPDSAQ